MLKIRSLQVSTAGKKILNGVDMSIESGQVVAIMGPNGSGKSTLAFAIAGHPNYVVDSGNIEFLGKNITVTTPDERSRMGLFLSVQYPAAIAGLMVCNYLWQIYKLHNKDKKMLLSDFRIWMKEESVKLGLAGDIMSRSLNDGFSGGEKKKMEVLQMLCVKPKLVILDEIDSGLDVESIKTIANRLVKMVQEDGLTLMAITHYSRILNYLKPSAVFVIKNGKVVASGDESLVASIEKEGYLKYD